MEPIDDWGRTLRAEAGTYARVALTNIKREFPGYVAHIMAKPGDLPYRPRARNPVFYGSFDWHSSVEMHWLLVRLLRVVPDEVPAAEIRKALRAHLERVALAAEEEFVASPDGAMERPYGWGWALMLVHEVAIWDDEDGLRWAQALAPFGRTLRGLFLEWLATANYPVRHGVHANSAFAMSLALPFADALATSGDTTLRGAIEARAHEWFGADILYPATFEPSGQDFLSPALTEAELMGQLLGPDDFAEWLGVFLPGTERGQPAVLFRPVLVPETGDGQIGHLHGLNASRAWCWRRLAEMLPAGDSRMPAMLRAARVHAQAALPFVVGSDYAIEHWLAVYAVLLLT